MTFLNPILNILVIIVLIYTLNYTFVWGVCLYIRTNVYADADTATAVFRLLQSVENSKCSAISSHSIRIFLNAGDQFTHTHPERDSLTQTGKLPLRYVRFRNIVYVFIHIVYMYDMLWLHLARFRCVCQYVHTSFIILQIQLYCVCQCFCRESLYLSRNPFILSSP